MRLLEIARRKSSSLSIRLVRRPRHRRAEAIGEPAAAHRPADGDGLHRLGLPHQRADPAGVIGTSRDGLIAAQVLGMPFT